MIEHDLPPSLRAFLAEDGFGDIDACEPLKGGTINETRRIRTSRGPTVIAKFSAQIPPAFYELEADGLAQLRQVGIRVPDVIKASDDFLLMEDFGVHPVENIDWRSFGHSVAHLHLRHDDQFGFSYHNYIGRLQQTNTRMADGHDFFAEHRIRAYLARPLCEMTCTPEDRRDIDKFASRLRDLIPEQPASLLHGDLWSGNIVPLGNGQAGLIDPAVYFGWAEADLTATWLYSGVPPAFFEAYNEVNPLEPGYMDRLPLLAVREWLAIIAQFGPNPVLMNIRSVIAPFL